MRPEAQGRSSRGHGVYKSPSQAVLTLVCLQWNEMLSLCWSNQNLTSIFKGQCQLLTGRKMRCCLHGIFGNGVLSTWQLLSPCGQLVGQQRTMHSGRKILGSCLSQRMLGAAEKQACSYGHSDSAHLSEG